MIGHLSIYRVLKFALLLGRGKIFGVVLFSFQLPLGASICQTKYTAEPALNKPGSRVHGCFSFAHYS